MAEQDPKKTPDRGPVPDPHADEPTPRPDPHTRPGEEATRPDQHEDLGPVAELFGAAGVEAATQVSDDPALREEAIRRGAEVEGLETAQIFGLLLATAVALVLVVVSIAVMSSRAGEVEQQRRLGAMAYPELAELRAADRERLGAYGREEDRVVIPLERAQQLLAAEAADAPAPNFNLPDSRIGFNLAYPRWGVPGLAPAPLSPAAQVEDARPVPGLAPESPDDETPVPDAPPDPAVEEPSPDDEPSQQPVPAP